MRATLAYCCVNLVDPLAEAATARGSLEVNEALFSLLGSVILAAIMVGYVHVRAKRIFGRPAGGVPIAVPRP